MGSFIHPIYDICGSLFFIVLLHWKVRIKLLRMTVWTKYNIPHWVFENIDLLKGTFSVVYFIYDYICDIGHVLQMSVLASSWRLFQKIRSSLLIGVLFCLMVFLHGLVYIDFSIFSSFNHIKALSLILLNWYYILPPYFSEINPILLWIFNFLF